jgi:hypothetical protein
MRRQNSRSNQQEASSPQADTDPILAVMKEHGILLTRENYLSVMYPEGVPSPLPVEIEADLPPQFQKRATQFKK